MRILIVDDEAPARRKLRTLLDRETDFDVVGEANDGDAAVTLIRQTAADLVLLDIQMPRFGGFEVIERVGVENMPMVVFVTAFDEHALRAFEVHAFDYLTKPFAARRLRATLDRAATRLAEQQQASVGADLRRLLDSFATPDPFLRRIRARRSPNREAFVAVEDIVVLRAQRNEVEIVTRDATYRRRSTLSGLESRLDPQSFVRINRSEIVRLDAISELQPWFHGDYRVILGTGETLSWSRRYRPRGDDLAAPGSGTVNAAVDCRDARRR